MSTKERFLALIGQMSNNYRREMQEADVTNFRMMLEKWGIDRFEVAVHAHMFDPDGGQYFPTIANIAKHAEGTAKQQAAIIEDKAAIAWADICEQIRKKGSYGTLKLEDKQALAAVKAMGGWQRLCQSTTDEMVWKRKEFIRLYETFERTPLEALPQSLPGRIELSEHKAQGAQRLDQLMVGIAKRLGVKDGE